MTRRISFYGYHKDIPQIASQENTTTPEQLIFIQDRVSKARKDEATAFVCEDYLHAIKVASSLRTSLGNGYLIVARRELVYIKGKHNVS
jgi:hypothetical protein